MSFKVIITIFGSVFLMFMVVKFLFAEEADPEGHLGSWWETFILSVFMGVLAALLYVAVYSFNILLDW